MTCEMKNDFKHLQEDSWESEFESGSNTGSEIDKNTIDFHFSESQSQSDEQEQNDRKGREMENRRDGEVDDVLGSDTALDSDFEHQVEIAVANNEVEKVLAETRSNDQEPLSLNVAKREKEELDEAITSLGDKFTTKTGSARSKTRPESASRKQASEDNHMKRNSAPGEQGDDRSAVNIADSTFEDLKAKLRLLENLEQKRELDTKDASLKAESDPVDELGLVRSETTNTKSRTLKQTMHLESGIGVATTSSPKLPALGSPRSVTSGRLAQDSSVVETVASVLSQSILEQAVEHVTELSARKAYVCKSQGLKDSGRASDPYVADYNKLAAVSSAKQSKSQSPKLQFCEPEERYTKMDPNRVQKRRVTRYPKELSTSRVHRKHHNSTIKTRRRRPQSAKVLRSNTPTRSAVKASKLFAGLTEQRDQLGQADEAAIKFELVKLLSHNNALQSQNKRLKDQLFKELEQQRGEKRTARLRKKKQMHTSKLLLKKQMKNFEALEKNFVTQFKSEGIPDYQYNSAKPTRLWREKQSKGESIFRNYAGEFGKSKQRRSLNTSKGQRRQRPQSSLPRYSRAKLESEAENKDAETSFDGHEMLLSSDGSSCMLAHRETTIDWAQSELFKKKEYHLKCLDSEFKEINDLLLCFIAADERSVLQGVQTGSKRLKDLSSQLLLGEYRLPSDEVNREVLSQQVEEMYRLLNLKKKLLYLFHTLCLRDRLAAKIKTRKQVTHQSDKEAMNCLLTKYYLCKLKVDSLVCELKGTGRINVRECIINSINVFSESEMTGGLKDM